MSTTAKGNAFRDTIASLLSAAGFIASTEVRIDFKKADARASWTRDDLDGPITYLVETKDYAGTLPLGECTEFLHEYGELVRRGLASRAWLISRGAISPDGRAAIEGHAGLKCFTLQELQRNLLRLDGYLRDLIAEHDAESIDAYYVRPHTEDDRDLETVVEDWLTEPGAPPLAVVSGYGKGKSTFAKHFASIKARLALNDPMARVPVLVPLGDILDDVGIDSLLGRVFSSRHRAGNYHFHLFQELNSAGRFLIILDGFDEMKHGMTVATFERVFNELMRFDSGDSRVLIFGRDTAFHNDLEFRSIILGRQTTTLGMDVAVRNRRPCRTVGLREFTPDEVDSYVRRYFPLRARQRTTGLSDPAWVGRRTDEILSGAFSDLLVRPVHAQMLCDVAVDPEVPLTGMTRLRLYDAFVHYLLTREVDKRGRDAAFPVEVRRRFNGEVAWWLWEQGGASTATLDAIPARLCTSAVGNVRHDYDEAGLKRELAAGLLVEKSSQTIYFAHRSIQEFLAAEHVLNHGLATSDPEGRDPANTLALLDPEIIEFMTAVIASKKGGSGRAREFLSTIDDIRTKISPRDLAIYLRLLELAPDAEMRRFETPQRYWLSFFHRAGTPDWSAIDLDEGALGVLREGLHREDLVGAALALIAGLLAVPTTNPSDKLAALLAEWLPRPELTEAMEAAREGKYADSQFRRGEQLALWTFLSTISLVEGEGGAGIEMHLSTLFSVMDTLGGSGLKLDRPTVAAVVKCPVAAFYGALRAKGVPDSEIGRLLPFFEDFTMPSKLRPVVVKRLGHLAVKPAARRRLSTPSAG